MKLLYKPFALFFSVIAARLGKGVFKSVWAQIDRGDPPRPTAENASLGKVVGAAALEAATMAGVSAAADRASARTFKYLTGYWPGDRSEEEEQKKKKKKKRKKG
jgi:hypothetical protein